MIKIREVNIDENHDNNKGITLNIPDTDEKKVATKKVNKKDNINILIDGIDDLVTVEVLESIDGNEVSRITNLDTESDEYKNYYNLLYEIAEDDEELSEALDNMETFLRVGFAEDVDNIDSFKSYNYSMYKTVRQITKVQPIANKKTIKTYDDEQLEFFKCKYDIIYWLENYCIIQGGGAFVRMMLNDHLRTVAKLFEASVLTTFVTSRQSSKTTIALACISWYFNFWSNTTMQLINLSVSDNNKNMQMIKMICQNMPMFLRTWIPEAKGSQDIDNIASKQSVLNSKIKGLTIDRQDPDSTGRGSTSALYFDEVGYLKGIEIAYASISFAFNTYSKMARQQYVPAPILNTSTPNDLMHPSGKFFHDIWTNAYEVSYNEIKDKLPSEIYDWFMELGVPSAKVYQPWYAFPGRVEKAENIDPDNPNNLIWAYEDINMSHERMKELDPVAARWLLETKQAVHFDLSKIKKDILTIGLLYRNI